jgi:hypothetical protein
MGVMNGEKITKAASLESCQYGDASTHSNSKIQLPVLQGKGRLLCGKGRQL